jgi:hypothetical protein
MGWDLYAKGKRLREAAGAFKAASDAVAALVGSVDGGLENGYLDCSACATWLRENSALRAYSDTSAQDVKDAFLAMKPPQELSEHDWPAHSTYHFIRVCAEYDLSLEASY